MIKILHFYKFFAKSAETLDWGPDDKNHEIFHSSTLRYLCSRGVKEEKVTRSGKFRNVGDYPTVRFIKIC